MKNGIAAWHYPHRSILENVAYFADHGYESVSLHGDHMLAITRDAQDSLTLARLVAQKGIALTVHHKLPASHESSAVSAFQNAVDRIAAWQTEHRLLSVYSFDVPQNIRDNVAPYIDHVLSRVPDCGIAVEDFGLTPNEREQIAYLKQTPRFGYLVDIGHMFIRLRALNQSGHTLFTHSDCEGDARLDLLYTDFLRAFCSKEFPILEMHLHSNDGADDLHFFLDDGILPLREVARAVKTFGFQGVMTIESAPNFRFECRFPVSDERIARTFEIWKNTYASV